MRDRVITVGSASKEYRMIGWRVGWVVGPASIVADVARVSISNVVCQTEIAMQAVATAINDPNDGIGSSVIELQARRDLLLDELVTSWSFRRAVAGLFSICRRLGSMALSPPANCAGSRYCRDRDGQLGYRSLQELPAHRLLNESVPAGWLGTDSGEHCYSRICGGTEDSANDGSIHTKRAAVGCEI
jgi:hypothetical protein